MLVKLTPSATSNICVVSEIFSCDYALRFENLYLETIQRNEEGKYFYSYFRLITRELVNTFVYHAIWFCKQ